MTRIYIRNTVLVCLLAAVSITISGCFYAPAPYYAYPGYHHRPYYGYGYGYGYRPYGP